MQHTSGSSPAFDHEETAQSSSSKACYVEVAVPVHVASTFTYRLPKPLVHLAQIGARAVVPLGRRFVTGYIVALHEYFPHQNLSEAEIKDAEEILDLRPVVTAKLIDLTRWVSDYYAAPWGEVIKAALPPGISPAIEQFVCLTEKGRAHFPDAFLKDPSKRALVARLREKDEVSIDALLRSEGQLKTLKAVRELEHEGLVARVHRSGGGFVKAKFQKVVRLASKGNFELPKLPPAQQRLVDILLETRSLPLRDLLHQAGASAASVHSLQKRGLVDLLEQPMRRDPLAGEALPTLEHYQLTSAQSQVLEEIASPLRESAYHAFLLHGVTGSGKTEVYIRAMRLALELGRSALMLVPEIALTPVFSRRLRAHFGDRVAIFHSSLSRGERYDEWARVRNGEARVVIGTRSAVFAPIQNLGIVVIDEEHESSYRQQDSPQYSGRDTAIVRAQKESAVVVLGSATPSLESFHNAQTGKYTYLQLPARIANRPLAAAEIIDMRKVFARHQKPRVFSDELLTAIEQTQARQEQSIILLNRRGYSSFVLCRSCGESIQCPNCDVTLTYHRSERLIICHYCDHRQAAPQVCPSCKGKYIYYVGEGTEQIEDLLQKRFPKLRIARIDKDTTARRRLFEKTLSDFSEGRLDMLVGTQMLAKGHDYPNVTLVGVVSVDAGLALPDFRAAERTFQLITQVAGRAGRGERPGQVLIQTYHPDHYALQHARAQDYLGFYSEEIRHRQNHSYPPFVALASLLIHAPGLDRVRSDALIIRKELEAANEERACRILGPAPAPIARLKGEFRFQLLLKSRNRKKLRLIADRALKSSAAKGVNLRSVNLDIDPVSIM